MISSILYYYVTLLRYVTNELNSASCIQSSGNYISVQQHYLPWIVNVSYNTSYVYLYQSHIKSLWNTINFHHGNINIMCNYITYQYISIIIIYNFNSLKTEKPLKEKLCLNSWFYDKSYSLFKAIVKTIYIAYL